jgi:small subunit ribosomal protein S20
VPNIKSQIKRVLTNNKANDLNNTKRSKIKNQIKKYNILISQKNVVECEKLLPEIISLIDAASSDGIFHKNNASRKVASLSKALSDIKKAQ